jgi:hypothetical protein
MDRAGEFLIVVDPRQGVDLDSLGAPVVQVASPRVGVVRADAATLDGLRQRPDVVAVVEQVLPATVVAELDDTERLFVEAWSQHGRPKQRPGEGRSWDAEGFEPPDS